MERAEFIVDAEGWKTFYRMKYKGEPKELLAFSALVNGTVQEKVENLFPEMMEELPDLKEELEPLVKKVTKHAKKVAKKTGLKKDYRKFARMWAAREILQEAGLELVPNTKGSKAKKILKLI